MRELELRGNTYRLGRNALKRLKTERSYLDWLAVSDALVEARNEALEAIGMTGSNVPASLRLGGGYNKAFSEILAREKLNSEFIDSTTRNELFQIAAHRAVIEAYRQQLPAVERAKLNHPSSIMRAYKKSSAAQDKRDAERKPSKLKETEAELAIALNEAEKLREHVRKMESAKEMAAGDPATVVEARSRYVDAFAAMNANAQRSEYEFIKSRLNAALKGVVIEG